MYLQLLVQTGITPAQQEHLEEAFAGNKAAKSILALLEGARRKAIDNYQPAQASFLKALTDLFDPSAPKEGFVKNCPLLLDTWRKDYPECLFNLFAFKSGSELSDVPDTVFQTGEFFKQGLDWLLRIAKGTVSKLGKQTFTELPMGKGK